MRKIDRSTLLQAQSSFGHFMQQVHKKPFFKNKKQKGITRTLTLANRCANDEWSIVHEAQRQRCVERNVVRCGLCGTTDQRTCNIHSCLIQYFVLCLLFTHSFCLNLSQKDSVTDTTPNAVASWSNRYICVYCLFAMNLSLFSSLAYLLFLAAPTPVPITLATLGQYYQYCALTSCNVKIYFTVSGGGESVLRAHFPINNYFRPRQ